MLPAEFVAQAGVVMGALVACRDPVASRGAVPHCTACTATSSWRAGSCDSVAWETLIAPKVA